MSTDNHLDTLTTALPSDLLLIDHLPLKHVTTIGDLTGFYIKNELGTSIGITLTQTEIRNWIHTLDAALTPTITADPGHCSTCGKETRTLENNGECRTCYLDQAPTPTTRTMTVHLAGLNNLLTVLLDTTN